MAKFKVGDRVRRAANGHTVPGDYVQPGREYVVSGVFDDGQSIRVEGDPSAGWVAEYFEPASGATDIVNSPDHYQHDGIETIDVIAAWLPPEAYRGYLRGNSVKYLSRCHRKGDELNDLRKSRWYLDRLISALEADA